MLVGLVHSEGRSLALRANQAEPQEAVGSGGRVRRGVDRHLKLLAGTRHAGQEVTRLGTTEGQGGLGRRTQTQT